MCIMTSVIRESFSFMLAIINRIILFTYYRKTHIVAVYEREHTYKNKK